MEWREYIEHGNLSLILQVIHILAYFLTPTGLQFIMCASSCEGDVDTCTYARAYDACIKFTALVFLSCNHENSFM